MVFTKSTDGHKQMYIMSHRETVSLSVNKDGRDQNALVGLSINLCLLFLIHVQYMRITGFSHP